MFLIARPWLSMIIKDLNLKAIHNPSYFEQIYYPVVNDHQRSESESNSQHSNKQQHKKFVVNDHQRSESESNSQRVAQNGKAFARCQ